MIPVIVALILAVGMLAPPAIAQPVDTGAVLFVRSYFVLRDEALARPTPETLLRGADAGLRTVLRDNGQPPSALGPLQLTGDERGDLSQLLQRIEQAQRMVRARPIAVTYGAVSGMVAAVQDPNTVFYVPEAFAEVFRRIMGEDNFVGIGIVIQERAGQVVIIEVLDETPASESGLRAGDMILAVNGVSTARLGLDQVSQMIRGAAGTEVVLRIQRSGQVEPLTLTLTRRRIQPRVVSARMLPSGVGYLRLMEFPLGSDDLFAEGLRSLIEQGARGIVLDLRGNPGGLLDASVNIASHFLERGVVVTVETGRGQTITHLVQPRDPKYTGPLVVLVDRGSASASEVVAGALQDAGIKLVGTRTYGKATVQYVHGPFPDGSGLRVTFARYLTPAGRDIDGRGLSPDVEVATDGVPIGSPDDAPLNRAVAILQQSMAVLPRAAP